MEFVTCSGRYTTLRHAADLRSPTQMTRGAHPISVQYKQKHLRSRPVRPPTRPLLIGLLLAVFAAGCSGFPQLNPAGRAPAAQPAPAPAEALPAVEAVAEVPDTDPAPPELTPEERAHINHLLDQAYYAMAADQLTSPYPGSALEAYDRVRQIQPDHPEARRGLEKIVERYLALAVTAAQRRQFAAAQGMLDRATIVDPDHPGIEPVQSQIRMLAAADRRVVTLDGDLLREQAPAVQQMLTQAGADSRRGDCWVEMFARNDAEGRWMYQQLNGSGGQRVRAQLNIGSSPRVELVCVRKSS